MATTTAQAGANENTVQPRQGTSEGAILGRVLESGWATLPVAAARAILDLGFPPDDLEQMRQLSAKAQEGTLSADEQVRITNYERVGHILSLMKAKARHSLKNRNGAHGKGKAH